MLKAAENAKEPGAVEIIARAICSAQGRHCAEIHPCDIAADGACKCPFWRREELAANDVVSALDEAHIRLVWMKPAVLPGPQRFVETTITITEPTTLTLQMGEAGGGGGP